jgi:hypothetical protein
MPNERQTLLLHAMLMGGDEAREKFALWAHDRDFDSLTEESFGLLPLLAASCIDFGIDADWRAKFRGISRRAWFQNQRMRHAGRRLSEALRHAHIDVLFLPEADLAFAVYPHQSMRPISYFDILMPREQVGDAVEVLRALGWSTAFDLPKKPADFALHRLLPLNHRDDRSLKINLHWRPFHWRTDLEAEKALWIHAEHLNNLSEAARVISPTDMLLYVCEGSMRWSRPLSLRWIADAMIILRRREIDWHYFLTQCERFHLQLPVRFSLDYLANEFGAVIPAQVHDKLFMTHPHRMDNLVFILEQTPPENRRHITKLRVHASQAWKMLGFAPDALMSYMLKLYCNRSALKAFRCDIRRAKQ